MKRKACKKVSLLLIFTVMIVSALTVTALAAEDTVSVLDGQITVKGEYETVLGVNTGSITESEDVVTVIAKSSMVKTARTTTVTITNATSSNAKITFDYSASNYGSFSESSASGKKTVDLTAGASITMSITCKKSWSVPTTATLTLSNFTYKAAEDKPTVTFDYTGGSITVDGANVSSGSSVEISSTDGAVLAVTASSGYKFLGWVNGTTNVLLSEDATYTLKPTEDVTIKAAFASATTKAWFKVGDYLVDDLNVAVGLGSVVVPMYDGTLPAGNYTIPSGVTLLIPFDDAHTLYTTTPGNTDTTYTKPTFYRTLTMSDGANITVNGAMSVSGKHCAKMGSNGLPSGPQGFVVMEKGSSITVNSGGNLYAWGYIVGEKRSANTETPVGGTVTIENGGTVYECFQVTDYRGGNATSSMASSSGDNIKTYRVFPMSQYYIQNVQVPMTLEAGAAEIGYMSVTVTFLGVQSAPVPFIGSNGLFRINSGSITKNYDEQNDRLVIDINGDLTMSTMTINIKVGAFGTVDLDSSQYVLPMAGNMTVNLNSGSTVTLAQDLALIPGGVLNIAEGATLNVGTSSKSQNLYVYDKEQWGGYCYSSSVTYRPLDYAYDRFAKRTEASLVDAKILVNGTLDSTCGYVYTTSGGANICSTGTGMFKVGTLGTQTVTYQATQADTTVSYAEISIAPAQLHNGTNTANFAGPEYTLTKDAATATAYTYCMTCDMWVKGENGLVHIIENGEIMGHAKTLAEAKGDYGTPAAGKYIQMLANSNGETVAFADGTVLDLNGNTITGTGVSVSGTLYGMDSTSDGYGLPKGSITISGTVAPVTEFAGKNNIEGDTATLHRYLAVNDSANVDTWSFHRYNLSVGEEYYLEVLSNNTARIGVSAYFRGNSAVRSKLSEMGILIGSATTPTATAVSGVTDPYTLYYTSDAAEMKLADLTPSVKAALKFTTNSNYYYSNPWTVDFVTLLQTYYQSADANAKVILKNFADVAGIALT